MLYVGIINHFYDKSGSKSFIIHTYNIYPLLILGPQWGPQQVLLRRAFDHLRGSEDGLSVLHRQQTSRHLAQGAGGFPWLSRPRLERLKGGSIAMGVANNGWQNIWLMMEDHG